MKEKRQLVIRTYAATENEYNNLSQLQSLLARGCEIKFVTPMQGYIEYILEEEIRHRPNQKNIL
jgi:hypothetical protein